MRFRGSIPGLAQWVKLTLPVSCGVGRRCGLDSVMLWLWRRLVATAPIRLLAWEPPYAMGVALEKAKRQKKEKKVIVEKKVVVVIVKTCSCVHPDLGFQMLEVGKNLFSESSFPCLSESLPISCLVIKTAPVLGLL